MAKLRRTDRRPLEVVPARRATVVVAAIIRVAVMDTALHTVALIEHKTTLRRLLLNTIINHPVVTGKQARR